MKKSRTKAEIQWRKSRSDEQWEKRADYLMEFFSQITTALPRQISHQDTLNASSKMVADLESNINKSSNEEAYFT